MKGLLIAAGLGLALLGAAVSTAGAAPASGKDHRHAYGSYPGYSRTGVVIYGPASAHYRRDHHRGGHRHAYRQSDHRGHNYLMRPPGHRFGRMPYPAARPCHLTGTVGFDTYGRPARIAGVKCYNAYGAPYIVHGSRFIIHPF